MSTVEEAYRSHIDSLTPVEKMQRVEELLCWTRDLLARLVRQELGEIDDNRLRREIALRMYSGDSRFLELLEQWQPDASR